MKALRVRPIFIIMLLLAALSSARVCALDEAARIEESAVFYAEPASEPVYSFAENSPQARLEKVLHDAIWEGQTEIVIDVGDYDNLSRDELRAIGELMYSYADLFALDPKGNIGIYALGTRITYKPVYQQDILADYDAAKAYYEQQISAIVAAFDPNMTDLQKLLFLNEYLTVNFEYDTTYTIYDTYHFLKGKIGVCQAYSGVVDTVLERLGIECCYVTSDSLRHQWNAVKLDGKWYHFDATWNDPLPNIPGYAGHSYFLVSSQKMKSVDGGAHYAQDDWVFSNGDTDPCTDTTYDAYLWQNARSPFVWINGGFYFVDPDGLKRWTGPQNSASDVKRFSQLFSQYYPQYNFHNNFVGLTGLAEIGGKLYFNSFYFVAGYDLASGAAEKLADVLLDGVYISGSWEETPGVFAYQIKNPSTGDTQTRYLTFPPFENGYGYYTENGNLHLQLDANARVLLAQYASGQMTQVKFYTGAGSYTIPLPEETVCIFSVDADFKPRAEKITLSGG